MDPSSASDVCKAGCMPKRKPEISPPEERPLKRSKTSSPPSEPVHERDDLVDASTPQEKLTRQEPPSKRPTRPSSPNSSIGRWLQDVVEPKGSGTVQSPSDTVNVENTSNSKSAYFPACEDTLQVLNYQSGTAGSLPDMSGRPTNPSETDTSRSRKLAEPGINAYHRDFGEELMRRRIRLLPPRDKGQPDNLDAFVRALRQVRSSPEPTTYEKEKVRLRVLKSLNELSAMEGTLPKLIQFDSIWDDERLVPAASMAWNVAATIPKPTGVGSKLVCPQPDYTVGWMQSEFPFPNALPVLRPHAAPMAGTSGLLFPAVAIEGKGDKGSVNISRLQSLHNGATMLWDLYQVRKRAGNEGEFLNKIQAITLGLTTQSVELCYHWLAEDDEGNLVFLSKVFETWATVSISMAPYSEARRCVRNAIDWILGETRSWIDSDLQLVEDRLRQATRQAQQITPPGSSAKGTRGKRKLSDDNDESAVNNHDSTSAT